MRQELIFRGLVRLPVGERACELWYSGSTVAAFEHGVLVGVVRSVELTLTDDRRLALSGTDEQGDPVRWEAVEAERVISRWSSTMLRWPDGATWTGAEVTTTQYGVRVAAAGHATVDLAAARTELVGGKRWIIDGERRILADAARRGCGCGGRR